MNRSHRLCLIYCLAACFLALDGEWGVPAAHAQFVHVPQVYGQDGQPAQRNAQESKQDVVRPEVGKPLQAAQESLKAQKFKEALAKIAETDALASKTPTESFIIERMRGAVAMQAGTNDVALKSFEMVLASGKLSPPDQSKMLQAVAGLAYRMKEYGKAASFATRYLKEGGTDAQTRTLLIQSHYLSGNYAEAAREMRSALQEEERAGQTPSEDQLQLLASSYVKQNDRAGYAYALEKMVTYHPKKEYWADLINRIQAQPGFSDRLSLDVFRLKLATGNLKSAAEYVEMAQLALQAALPLEAKKVIAQGYASGALGTGPEAERHQRLRDLAARSAAEDEASLARGEADIAAAQAAPNGTALVNYGYAYVQLGRYEQGIAMMEQGLRKGGLKRLEDAKLHLGIAYLQAGKKAQASQILKTVQGSDGLGDLARLWALNM